MRALASSAGIAALPIISLARLAGNSPWSTQLSPETAVVMFLLIAVPLSTAALLLARRRPEARAARSVSVLAWIALALLQFGTIRPYLEGVGWVETWQWAVATVVALAIAVWIAVRFDPGARFVSTFVPVLVVVQIIQLGFAAQRWEEPEPAAVAPLPVELGDTPSMWIILLDSHGSPAALRDLHDVDLSEQIARLETAGLTVWDDARTSYSHTLAAVPSLLSGRIWDPTLLEASLAEMLAGSHGDTPLLASLTEAGHTYRMIPANWSRSRCGELADVCRELGGANEQWYFLMLSTPFPDVFPGLFSHPWPTGGVEALEIAADLTDDGRHITFVHSLASHPPAVLNEHCDPVSVVEATRGSQLVCTHAALAQTLAAIDLTTDVVIVVADHGYGSLSGDTETWTDDLLRARFSAFTAISTPDDCEAAFPERLSVPQILPLVLNCYGADLPVPDHRFFSVGQRRNGTIGVIEVSWDGWSRYTP